MKFDRITLDSAVMGGKPCVRGMRVTAATILGLMAAGHPREKILKAYPYLETEDFDAVLAYAAWRLEERETEMIPLAQQTDLISRIAAYDANPTAGSTWEEVKSRLQGRQ